MIDLYVCGITALYGVVRQKSFDQTLLSSTPIWSKRSANALYIVISRTRIYRGSELVVNW